MQFIHQPLTWAFFLVLAPVLIHLINLLRHRTLSWAAMDFLQQSYRKQRRWIRLKQLLLLLLRMLAIAAVVAMLAQMVSFDQWGGMFQGRTTHHYLVLDDSFSMSDRTGDSSVFQVAQEVIRKLVEMAKQQNTIQRLTLVRCSRALRTPARKTVDQQLAADINAQPIGADFDLTSHQWEASDLSVSTEPALEFIGQLIEQAQDQKPVVYLLSDFRAKPWRKPAEVRRALKRLQDANAELHLVRCADQHRANLSLVRLEPAPGTLAAGVPMVMTVTVRNHGPEPAKQVPLSLGTWHYASAPATNGPSLPTRQEPLPSIVLEQIPAGEAVTEQFQVYFPVSGQHVVHAELPSDAVDVDNQRWSVLDISATLPVLVIDGDDRGRNTYYLNAVFSPGGSTKTGIEPVAKPISFLRDASLETLSGFHAIYLLDFGRLDQRTVSNVESYVRQGGGVALFLGPKTDIGFLTNWHKQGKGLFPLSLSRVSSLPPRRSHELPDLQFNDHTLFRAFRGERNPLLRGISISEYYESPTELAPNSRTTILATLRDGRPLIAERPFGAGRAVAFLTTLQPSWNNWAREPSLVVVLLELQSYLASSRHLPSAHLVGDTLEVQLDLANQRPNVRFFLPSDTDAQRSIEAKAVSPNKLNGFQQVALGGSPSSNPLAKGPTDKPGIYQVHRVTLAGEPMVQKVAMNVDPTEGDLTLVNARELATALEPIDVQIYQAQDLAYASNNQAGFAWSQLLLWCLLGLLIGEQCLAYSASYHPRRGEAR